MAENINVNSTFAKAQIDTPAPKENTPANADALTRVNTPERKSVQGTDVDKANAVSEKLPDEHNFLSGRKLAIAQAGFLLAMFCVGLDQTIVATALPKLASQFNALDQLTWVITAYFITQAGLMLTFGQILTIASSKWVYLSCIVIFEIGSLICGVAPSIEVLIFGRAIQGVGASGIFIAVLAIIAQIAKIEQRPLLFGTFGAVYALASIIGPLLGGALTDKASWRWCFYINLPIGAISVATIVFFVPAYPPPESKLYENSSALQRWLAMDWIGSAISVAMITCLLLPLQWGGVTRPWNDKVVIALFCVFAVLFIAFVAWELFKGDRAMLPFKLLRRRTQVGAGATMFVMMICWLAATYYLPFFYQAKGRSAAQSGIDILGFMISAVVANTVAAVFVNMTGHYWTMLIVGPLVGAVGAGLLFTIDEYTSGARIIGYQIIFGTGLGVALQLPVMAIQAEYADEPELIPQASSLLTFLQLLGGVVGIAIAGTVFNNQLVKFLAQYAGDLPPETIEAVKRSVTVIFELRADLQAAVVHSYVKALDYTFILMVPASALMSVAGLFVKNWNLKQRAGSTGEQPAA